MNLREFIQKPKRFQTTLLNQISGPRPAMLIGTIDANGTTNLAIFNSIIHLGADPALIGFLMRPLTVERNTYQNIMETGQYTMNHVGLSLVKQAHQTSAKYQTSEFAATGLHEDFVDDFKAPFVQESGIRMGLTYVDQKEIPQNGTILMIGEVSHIDLNDELISEEGYINLEKAGSVAVAGLNSYYQLSRIGDLPYAHPENNHGRNEET